MEIEKKNLSEELNTLRTEIDSLDTRKKELTEQINKIEFEMAVAGEDPFEDRWFIIKGVGNPTIVFYSKRSPDNESKYNNILRLSRKDRKAWAPIIFEGYVICFSEDCTFRPFTTDSINVSAENCPGKWSNKVRKANEISVDTYCEWPVIFLEKEDAIKRIASEIEKHVTRSENIGKGLSLPGFKVKSELKLDIEC